MEMVCNSQTININVKHLMIKIMKNLVEEQQMTNGFNTTQLGRLVETLEASPGAGNVTFKCKTRWQDGARAFHHFSGYQIDGQSVHEDGRTFVVLSDEPSEFGVSDAAPSPAEQLIGALAGCVTATTNAYASLNGVEITDLKVDVDGDLNLQGMLALRDDVAIGFKNIRIKTSISGNASEEILQEMAELGYKYSPIRNTVSHNVPVELDIQAVE
jgi:uncharacterized OsmC-like protein